MDFILLLMVSKLSQTKTTGVRIVLGSIIGAIISCLLLISNNLLPILRIIISYIITSVVMILICFRYESVRKLVTLVLYLYGVTILLGGILCSLFFNTSLVKYINQLLGTKGNQSISIFVLGIAVGVLVVCLPFVIRYVNAFRKRMNNIFDVSILLENRRIAAKALLDTGNHLREPLTNKPVIIVEKTLLKQIMTKELLEYTTRIKVIPYRSIGKEHGTMYALVLDQIDIVINNEHHKHDDVIACVYEGTLSSKKDYQLILHEELI